MAPSASPEHGAELVEAKLRGAWRKERRFHHSNGLAHLLLWLAALLLVDLFVDWLFRIPGYGRLILLAINVGAVGWVLWHYWLRHLRRYDLVRVALQVERRHPELESLLVSFVQLRGGAPEGAYASPSLLRALRRQTIDVTRPIDFREIINFAELKRIFVLSACVVAFFALYSVNWSDHVRVLLVRLLDPTSRLRYPTRTTIEAITGDVAVKQGDSITLAAAAGGHIPRRGTLYVRPRGGAEERLIVFPGPENQFAYRFREVYQPFDYAVRLGDASSDRHTVSVIPPPRIVETRVRLRLPAYAGGALKEVDFLNLEAPEGTGIEWELHCDIPLASAAMLREENDARPMALEQDGRVARLAAQATESFAYHFRWQEREHGYDYEDEIHYFVQVIPDSPPQVDIVFPTEDDKATVQKTLTCAFLARDDYRVGEAWFVYRVNEGEEKQHPIGEFAGALVEHEAVWKLRDTITDLDVDDVLTYAVEVRDNHDGDEGPHVTRSEPRRLFIVSVEEYKAHILEKRRRLRAEMEGMRIQEQEAADHVDRLEQEAEGP